MTKRQLVLILMKIKEQFQILEPIVCLSVVVTNQASITAGTSNQTVKQSNSNSTSLSLKNIFPLRMNAFMIKFHFRIMASVRIIAWVFTDTLFTQNVDIFLLIVLVD